MNKDVLITFRVPPEGYATIKVKADQAHKGVSTCIRAITLHHKIVVVDGFQEHINELKSIGRSLNQMTILACKECVAAVNLFSTFSALEKAISVYEFVEQSGADMAINYSLQFAEHYRFQKCRGLFIASGMHD